jgi:hypothetical protein
MKIVVQKFNSLDNWSDNHSFVLNSFLQERFLMASIITEANQKLESLKRLLEIS